MEEAGKPKHYLDLDVKKGPTVKVTAAEKDDVLESPKPTPLRYQFYEAILEQVCGELSTPNIATGGAARLAEIG